MKQFNGKSGVTAAMATAVALANLDHARTNLEMIVAVLEAQRVGGSVTFPPKNRKNPPTMLER